MAAAAVFATISAAGRRQRPANYHISDERPLMSGSITLMKNKRCFVYRSMGECFPRFMNYRFCVAARKDEWHFDRRYLYKINIVRYEYGYSAISRL